MFPLNAERMKKKIQGGRIANVECTFRTWADDFSAMNSLARERRKKKMSPFPIESTRWDLIGVPTEFSEEKENFLRPSPKSSPPRCSTTRRIENE